MNKTQIGTIKDTLSVLVDQPLRSISRGGASIFLNFGELVEKEVYCRDENGVLVRNENGDLAKRKQMVGKFALHIGCSMRLTCGDEIIVAKGDIFLPNGKIESNPNFDWDTFEWDIVGNNFFDETVAKLLDNEAYDFAVKKITVNKFGDLSITLTNEFILEFFSDASRNSENWRFFETGSDKHLVMTGQGLQEEEIEE